MPLTTEQEPIVDHIVNTEGLTLIDSVAGSGKTTILVTIAKTFPHSNGLYLAYNKSIATEAARKFPKTTHCLTTHSLAYSAIVKPMKLNLGNFNYKSITERVDYTTKLDILAHFKAFCLSKYTSVADYAKDHEIEPKLVTIINGYLNKMSTSKIDCTHEFYLKLFHMKLANEELEYPPFDFIMLDEAGDLNEVTLEIFRLLPSTRKIAVGDPFQNIYSFNHTINCFEVLKDEGTLFRMSLSFRVSDKIAPGIEKFCQKFLDPAMSFKGVPIKDKTIHNQGYITRTNASLIRKMIERNDHGLPYGLVRHPSEIFKTPLMLCGIKYKGIITDPAYNYLQEDIDDWHESKDLRKAYNGVLAYLGSLYQDDIQLLQAIRLVLNYGKTLIISTYEESRIHYKAKQSYTLTTAHSCKGLEFDEVELSDDLNDTVADVVKSVAAGRDTDTITKEEYDALNLYYVAVTRCSKVLKNAKHL